MSTLKKALVGLAGVVRHFLPRSTRVRLAALTVTVRGITAGGIAYASISAGPS